MFLTFYTASYALFVSLYYAALFKVSSIRIFECVIIRGPFNSRYSSGCLRDGATLLLRLYVAIFTDALLRSRILSPIYTMVPLERPHHDGG